MSFYLCDDDGVGTPRAIVTCDCASECCDLRFQVSDEPQFGGLLYVSGHPRRHPSPGERLRLVWRLLTTGSLWPDTMCIDALTTRRLGEWLSSQAQRADGAGGRE